MVGGRSRNWLSDDEARLYVIKQARMVRGRRHWGQCSSDTAAAGPVAWRHDEWRSCTPLHRPTIVFNNSTRSTVSAAIELPYTLCGGHSETRSFVVLPNVLKIRNRSSLFSIKWSRFGIYVTFVSSVFIRLGNTQFSMHHQNKLHV